MARIFDLEEQDEMKKGTGWESFKLALWSHGLFVLGGLISGLLLIVIEDAYHWKAIPSGWRHILGLSFEHLGLGLIVSSIAVFGYEWRSHVKKVVDLSSKLQESIHEAERIRKTIRETGTLLELLTKTGGQSLDPALRAFLGEDNRSLCTSLRKFIEAISEIQRDKADDVLQSEDERRYTKSVKTRYISVTEWLLQRVVLTNTLQFQKVINGGEGHFNVPATSGNMADQILATQMGIMDEGDGYDVISDVSSWRDNSMIEFRKASIAQIQSRKVKVRRVFNLFRHGLPPATSASYQEACGRTIRTLYEHFDASENLSTWRWKGYELKIFWEEELKEAMEIYPEFREHEFLEAHFGLFIHKEPRKVIRFKVELEDLSNMMINWDPDETERDVALFKAMWRVAEPLSRERIGEIEKKLLERIPSK